MRLILCNIAKQHAKLQLGNVYFRNTSKSLCLHVLEGPSRGVSAVSLKFSKCCHEYAQCTTGTLTCLTIVCV